MINPNYQIIFKGEMKKNVDFITIQYRLNTLFNQYGNNIADKLFTKHPIILKKHLKLLEAKKYQTIFQKTGAICHIMAIEPETKLITQSITIQKNNKRISTRTTALLFLLSLFLLSIVLAQVITDPIIFSNQQTHQLSHNNIKIMNNHKNLTSKQLTKLNPINNDKKLLSIIPIIKKNQAKKSLGNNKQLTLQTINRQVSQKKNNKQSHQVKIKHSPPILIKNSPVNIIKSVKKNHSTKQKETLDHKINHDMLLQLPSLDANSDFFMPEIKSTQLSLPNLQTKINHHSQIWKTVDYQRFTSYDEYKNFTKKNKRYLQKSTRNMALNRLSDIGISKTVSKYVIGTVVTAFKGAKINLNKKKTFFLEFDAPTSHKRGLLFKVKIPLE
jgi:hypothetical protein